MELIICKSEAFKIDLFTEDNFRKTAIGYFKTQDQKDLKEYAFKKNIGVLLTGGLWSFELEELRYVMQLRENCNNISTEMKKMMDEKGN